MRVAEAKVAVLAVKTQTPMAFETTPGVLGGDALERDDDEEGHPRCIPLALGLS